MYKVKVEVPFRYGHRLIAPYQGKCNNVHGEGGIAIVEIGVKELDEEGMAIDFGKLKSIIKEWIDENFDHAYIHAHDDEVGKYLKGLGMKTYNLINNPTAENMAKTLYLVLKQRLSCDYIKVGIVESFTTSIAYYEE